MSTNKFIKYCLNGGQAEAMSICQDDPRIINEQDLQFGGTGLMASLAKEQHSITRWLLSLPWLDATLRTKKFNFSALHLASYFNTPLDIVIQISEFSKKFLNSKALGCTPLDLAVMQYNTSTELHLTYLGTTCKPENKNKRLENGVTLDNWIFTGCQYQAQYWAVVANNISDLREISTMKYVDLDVPNLKILANVFNRQKIRTVWGEVPSLQSLAMEELQHTTPSLAKLPPPVLRQKGVPCHIVKILNQNRPSRQQIFNGPPHDQAFPDQHTSLRYLSPRTPYRGFNGLSEEMDEERIARNVNFQPLLEI